MKLKYETLTEDCIEQLLFEINQLYLSKEQKSLKIQKQFYESELAKIKKKN